MGNVTRRTFGFSFGAALFVGVSSFTLHAAQAQELKGREVVLGAIVPSSGHFAEWGRTNTVTLKMLEKKVNDAGGINGRPLEIVTEDDGTDPKRGAEVVEKFANQHKVDVVYGTLFSHVVVGSAPAAGELPGAGHQAHHRLRHVPHRRAGHCGSQHPTARPGAGAAGQDRRGL